MNFRKLFPAALVASVFVASPASAVILIEFDDVTLHGGTVSYNGTGGAAVGTDIIFDIVMGTGTPSNAGASLTCTGCKLNFTTGANVSEGSAGGAPWIFGSGGAFLLTGSVYNGMTLVASGTLVSGSFTGSPLVTMATGTTNVKFNFSGFGIDVKNDDLEAFFGLGPNTDWQFSNTEINLRTSYGSGSKAFSGTVEDADLINTAMLVPEPASLALLGLGLLGIGATRRRK